MEKEEFYSALHSNCLGEFEKNGDVFVFYVDFDESTNEIIAGDVTNAGIIPIVRLPFFREHTIQSHIDAIYGMFIKQGYFPEL